MWPPFVNQLVVEGAGPLDAAAWRAAVDAVLPAWPAVRARLRGALGWTRWVADGPAPAVVEVEGADWDGRGPAAWTARPLDPVGGPIVEVLLLSGATPRVILRTHHAAFDGRAAWALAEDLGAALRGGPIRGADFADLSDVVWVGAGPKAVEPPPDACAPTGKATDASGGSWVRVSLPTPSGAVLPRTIVALAHAAAAFVSGPLRVSVPVDLRRHSPGVRIAANLTGFVRVSVSTVEPDFASVSEQISAALARGAEADVVRGAAPLRHVPLAALVRAGRGAAAYTLRTGRGATSATISNLGKLDAAVLDGAGFRGERLYWVPPSNPGTPLFVALTGHTHGLELCAAMPAGFADGGRLEALVAEMARRIAVSGA